MRAVIDFEGFLLRPGCFVIKELAFQGLDDGFFGHWIFLPPIPWESLNSRQKATFTWLTKNLHKIPWNSGEIPYVQFQKILFSLTRTYSEIFVKGLEKKVFLEKLMGCVIHNLEDVSCPKVDDLPLQNITCFFHAHQFEHCALVKAVAFGRYINSCEKKNIHHLCSTCQPSNTLNI